MLTEGQLLYIFIILIYLSECVVWLPGHAFVFVRGLGGKWRVLLPNSGLGNERGRFIMTNPLPFAGGMCVSTHWPLAFGEGGIGAVKRSCPGRNRRPPRLFRVIPWASGPFASVQRAVIAAGQLFFTASTHREATWLAELMEQAAASPKKLPVIEKSLRKTLDVKAFAGRMAVFHGYASWLSIFAVTEFLLLFAFAPYAWAMGSSVHFLLTIGLLFLHTVVASFIFFAAHRRLYPERKGERWQQFIFTALVPTHSIRAADFLSRGLAGDRHALAVARALTSESQQTRVAGIFLRDLHHPMPRVEQDANAMAIADEFHELEFRLVAKAIKEAGLKEEDLLAAPRADSETSKAYCPRCQAQYVAGVSVCPDCHGVELAAFGKQEAEVG